ncbi:hypothetical protein [Sphingobacterium hungaricum]|uniref:Uncharacterized protein n=1 Tax=Sphingobacterium hungaricum TaxID=2082723 RepID=A0A928UWY7_9SPHI|nr:hypothetical protein [Sphingobacterium hungaricum]MBE8712629.1 hypothetical protein [Sphingobacterium hungaricum]
MEDYYEIVYTYYSLTIKNFIAKMQLIISKMTGNSNFTELQEEVATLSPKLKTLIDIQTQIDAEIPHLVNDRTEQLNVCNDALRNLGLGVQLKAKGKYSLLITTGYDLVKKTKSKVVLGSIVNFTAKNTSIEGKIIVSCDKVTGANTYIAVVNFLEQPVDKHKDPLIVPGSTKSIEIYGLPLGANLSIQLIVTGTNSQVVVSDLIYKTVVKQD